MKITKILNNRLPYYYHTLFKKKIQPPLSYGQYLKKESKRNKNQRHKIIKEWYDFIYYKKK